tara:strand:- start:703 stop:2133 length:1431 start_codon:yes stop_codon:yes gene_type:complete
LILKKYKIKTLILLISTIIISGYLLISTIIGNNKFQNLKLLVNDEQRQLIKKYIFPYKYISQQQKTIDRIPGLEKSITNYTKSIGGILKPEMLLNLELSKKESGEDITINLLEKIKLSKNLSLKKYQLQSGFYYGINNSFPGSGFLDFYEDNVIILSSRGILAFKKDLENHEENLKQIKNNIHEITNYSDLTKWFSLKDIFIFKNKVFISHTAEIKKDCWNIEILFAEMNFRNMEFKKIFSSNECIHSTNNIDQEFNGGQSGGRMVSFDDNHILLSIGDFRSRFLAQDKKSINGKIIKVNIYDGKHEVISMGHRNPQGLIFDKENNFILETEHGPQGGDEINLIDVNKVNKGKIQNYGWAISSAGEHYLGKIDTNKKKYEKYPLYKSHNEYGFIEPLKSFVPSIGISEIVKIGHNKYVVSSMRDMSLYFFEINEKKQIINLNRVEVFERVRDLKFKNNQLLLFMEDTASIGVINLN